jgi:hypothetical protein
MIRHDYENWNKANSANPESFWANTFNSSSAPIERLDDAWVNDWLRLVSFRGTSWEAKQCRPPIFASTIDTSLAFWLGQIREEALPPPVGTFTHISNNLAAGTLLRGHTLRLRSAERIIEEVNRRLPTGKARIPILPDYRPLETFAAAAIIWARSEAG